MFLSNVFHLPGITVRVVSLREHFWIAIIMMKVFVQNT